MGSEKPEKKYYTYRIRVANSTTVQVEERNTVYELVAEPSGDFRYKGELRDQIAALIEITHQNGLKGFNQVKKLGEALFKALFNDTLRQDFINLYEQAVHKEGQFLRIELDIDEQTLPEIAALPWEFMCLPEEAQSGTLWLGAAPNLIFSRRRAQWHPALPIELKEGERLRLALVIAAPEGLESVEYQKIETDLQKLAAEEADRIELLPIVEQANAEAIDQILERKPHLFHFIGHGRIGQEQNKPVGQIALVDDFNEAMWVNENYFSNLFGRHRPGVVILQACQGGQLSASRAFAGVASRIVQQNIPVVVAMQYEVSNSTASRFARRFYQKLAQGEPVDSAAQDGRYGIALGPEQFESRDFATPVIFMRVQNGHLFKRQAAPKLVQIQPPATQEQKIHLCQVLSGLNYTDQRRVFEEFVYEAAPKVAAFLISGPEHTCGQGWLLKRFIASLPTYGRDVQPIKLNFEQVGRGNIITTEFLWEQLASHTSLAGSSSAQQVANAICQTWREKHVVLIFANVTDYLLEIKEVWDLLAQAAQQAHASPNWLLLFLVNEKEPLPQIENLEVIQQCTPHWQPKILIRLPELDKAFKKSEICGWLVRHRDEPALASLKPQLDANEESVLSEIWETSDYGLPVSTLRTIYEFCVPNPKWHEVRNEWLKL